MNFENPIWVASKIDPNDFFRDFTLRFSQLMQETKESDVMTVFINSSGGDTHTALGVYDLIRNCKRQTVGVVVGAALSGASLILQACQKRIMTPNSTLMLHRSRISFNGSVDDCQAAVDTFRELDERFYEIYAEKTGVEAEKIETTARGDRYFTARQAIEFGLIDSILE